MTKRVTHTKTRPFDALSDTDMKLWQVKAQQFIGRQNWSIDDFDYAEAVYATAVYLFHMDSVIKKKRTFPCYVVHNVDDDERFESDSHAVAHQHFKRLVQTNRVAMFHWPDAHTQKRLHASDDYPYERDFGPLED